MTPTVTMERPAVESTEACEEQESRCHHHWVIDAPQGPTSGGVCKFCGAQREFVNYLGDLIGEHDGVPWTESLTGRWNLAKSPAESFD